MDIIRKLFCRKAIDKLYQVVYNVSNEVKIMILVSYIIDIYVAYILLKDGDIYMREILIAVLPALITGLITFVLARKSQIRKNTEAIENLSKHIGNKEEQSLEGLIRSIKDDIGRQSDSSLTRQHQNINRQIENSFGVINNRYEREDEQYRLFTREQHSLKETLDNFSKDYMNNLQIIDNLQSEKIKLEDELEKIREENNNLKIKIAEYQVQLEDYME